MSIVVAIVLGVIAAIAAMVLLYWKVLPKKLDGKLGNKYLQGLHDYFHFKKLYVEDIMKFLFTLATVVCVTIGFFMLFSVTRGYFTTSSNFLSGLMLMVLGPIVLRITYELVMMTILAVRNIIEINNKLSAAPKAEEIPAAEEPATQE